MSAGLRVAVVGTGRMGAAMVGRLAGAGHHVTVHNRTRAKAEAVAARHDAAVAPTPVRPCADADVVLVSLADDAAVTAAYGGPDGLVAGLAAGQVVADTSTVDPDTCAGWKRPSSPPVPRSWTPRCPAASRRWRPVPCW